jgi:hypothetical protein
MTQYEIIQMANEAGLNSYRIAPAEAVAVWERFAALVAAKEREACAQVCESWADEHDYAGAIRARGTAAPKP